MFALSWRALVVLSLLLLLAAPAGRPAAAQTSPPAGFADWHLPLPAGEWVISRGACGVGQFHHQCGYYEDHCAIDLTSPLGSMEHVPVLAPQSGQVFFVGARADSGLAVLLQHPDGLVSALMHLSRIVVAPDQLVARGQVLGYAGNTGSSSRAHLHFHVQPNTVERACLPLDGLDAIDPIKATAVSRNLPWSSLTLVDPPAALPAWLPLDAPGSAAVAVPSRLVLAPLGRVDLPLAIPTSQLAGLNPYFAGRRLQPVAETPGYKIYAVPLAAPQAAGDYIRLVHLRAVGRAPGHVASPSRGAIRLRLSVRPPAASSAGDGLLLINPTFVGPANYSEHKAPPRLCWSEPASAGQPPLLFRVMVVGPRPADSGWISDSCWQTPALPAGVYHWKVFVRDGRGFMNRTNQRPFVFKLH